MFFYSNLLNIYCKFLFNLVFFNFTKFSYFNKFSEALNQKNFFSIMNFKKRFFIDKFHAFGLRSYKDVNNVFVLQFYKNVNSYLTKLFLILFCKIKNNFMFYKKYKIIFNKINVMIKNEHLFYKKYRFIFYFFGKLLKKIKSNSNLYLMSLRKYISFLEIESADLFNRDVMLYNVSSIIDNSKEKKGKQVNNDAIIFLRKLILYYVNFVIK